MRSYSKCSMYLFQRIAMATLALTFSFVMHAAEASLIAYEGFDYTAGQDFTAGSKDGGTGWSSAWNYSSANPVVGSGLTYDGLPSTGGSWEDTGTTTISPTTISRVYTTVNSSYSTGGSSLWFSALVDPNGTTATGNDIKFYALGYGDNRGAGFRVLGNSSGGGTVQAASSTNYSSVSLTLSAGVNLILGRVNFTTPSAGNTGYQTTIWLNPNISLGIDGLDAGASTLVQTYADNTTDSWSADSWTGAFVRGSGNFVGNLDEIRIGTDFVSVVPEPATIFIMIGGGALLLRRRRVSGYAS